MIPKYRWLADEIERRIRSGAYPVGSRIPTEQQIAAQQNICRQTAGKAYDLLGAKGLLIRKKGGGSYVCDSRRKTEPTGRIGVVATDIRGYIFSDILNGIERGLTEGGYRFELATTRNSANTERKLLAAFLEDPIDGLIIEGVHTTLPNPNADLYAELRRRGLPLVFLNGHAEQPDALSVCTDDEAGGRALTEYAIQKGCRRIGGVFQMDILQGPRRYVGYAQALFAHGIDLVDESVVWYHRDEYMQFLERFRQEYYWKRISSLEAVVCYNDIMAVRIHDFYREMSCEKMPLILGMDDVHDLVRFPYATVGHPKEAMGREAARLLLGLIRGEHVESCVMSWSTVREYFGENAVPAQSDRFAAGV